MKTAELGGWGSDCGRVFALHGLETPSGLPSPQYALFSNGGHPSRLGLSTDLLHPREMGLLRGLLHSRDLKQLSGLCSTCSVTVNQK